MTRDELRSIVLTTMRERDKARGPGAWVGDANKPLAIALNPDDYEDVLVEKLSWEREELAWRMDKQLLWRGIPLLSDPGIALGEVEFTWPDEPPPS